MSPGHRSSSRRPPRSSKGSRRLTSTTSKGRRGRFDGEDSGGAALLFSNELGSQDPVASGSHGSPETKLPLELLSGNPFTAGELPTRLGCAAVLVVRVGLVVGRRQEQGTLDGVSGRSQANEQPARSRQILLRKGVDDSMQGCAMAHGGSSCYKPSSRPG